MVRLTGLGWFPCNWYLTAGCNSAFAAEDSPPAGRTSIHQNLRRMSFPLTRSSVSTLLCAPLPVDNRVHDDASPCRDLFR